MPKKSKVITNQVTPEELKAKIEAIDEPVTPPEEPVVLRSPDITPPPENPEPTVPETPAGEEGLDLELVRDKDPAELTDEEQTFLEENKAELTDEEKLLFSIEESALPATVPPTTPPDDTDWKARYAGSTREAQVLASRNKQITETIEKANALGEPTDEEMQKELGEDWEIMDETQRKIARKATLAARRFEMIHQATLESKKTDEWIDKVKTFSQDPQVVIRYPQLEGREIEFAQFCSIPSRVGVELEDLVKAFTFDIKPEVPQRKSLFERGTGGQPSTPKELTVEEISFLRIHDNKKYKELVKSGKVKIEV